MSGCALVIFAKAPVAGLAKTRLIPALGAHGAAALAGRMLAHAVRVGAAAGLDSLEICAAPDASHPVFGRLAHAHGLALSVQGDGDLGARMHRAFTRVLAARRGALLVGTDAPALDADMLAGARAALHTHDAVFVPALDGGYALVGLRAPQPALFEQMAWSTSTVMAGTRERLRAAGLRWAELPAVADVDEPADLAHLPKGWLP
ncbi:TIGR04282 family arsenosugar biosynthesis glycosyltransferase [Ramlibacter sp. AW1]|uniref:TIGR04282 family arsenosugar biosynthesis glycosyltransferase n=1 Tax=Ramlibacter aurantiacus TaxID=2801330 RepID=A0A936ZM77_9BURK|nr:TIGR04282 family arsenosugar biosynthesis glycosyltransferase [Ramlibacter aurantiacus]MBL0418736.1 TIGR04282 family arsenosugar biosynthesis glycosyltransferase [Ramlibacter aurantiacus]